MSQEVIHGTFDTVVGTGGGTKPNNWNIGTSFFIATESTGGLTISNGGDVTVSANTLLGTNGGGNGRLTVTGAGSTFSLTGGSLRTGTRGTSLVEILNGGQLSAVGIDSLRVAGTPSGDATINVSGADSLLDVDSMIMSKVTTGSPMDTDGGLSSLTVSNGGAVDIRDWLEYGPDGTATVTVTGSGSTLNVDEIDANGDNGRMDILLGGVVNANRFKIDKTADLQVSGAGSRMNLGVDFEIAGNHSGSIDILSGGVVDITDGFYWTPFSALAPGEGQVTVSGVGAQLLVGTDMFINEQAGNLRISDGAVVDVGGLFSINVSPSTTWNTAVSGAGSTLAVGDILTVGEFDRGDMIVSQGANLTVGNELRMAFDAGSTGTLTIGAASGNSAVAAGWIHTPLINFGAGTGRLVFNHTASNYIFDADMTGAGILDFYAGNTQLTGNLSGFGGSVNIYGGRLALNSVSNGTVNVLSGGTLGGTGTVADLTLASGGTVAPGNSIGTLSVAGNVNFGAGSTYAVEIDSAGNSDRINATGAITIDNGAILSVMPENGTDNGTTYLPSTTYTVLQGGSLTGTFGTLTDSFAFLDARASYDATTAYLTLDRNDLDLVDLALTPNQRAVSATLDNLGGGTLYDEILGLTDQDVASAYDALSGEIHPSLATNLMMQGNHLSATLSDRLYATGAGTIARSPAQATDIWMAGIGQVGQIGSDGNGHARTATSGGILVGADKDMSDTLRLGLAGAYIDSHMSQSSLLSSADARSYYLAAYGSQTFGPAALSFGASHGWNDIETKRSVGFGSFTDQGTAGYGAWTTQAFIEAGLDLEYDSLQIRPFNRVDLAHVSHDGFSEQGGAAALTGDKLRANHWTNMLGLKLSSNLDFNDRPLVLRGSLGWRRVLGDRSTSSTMAFDLSDAFTIASAAVARDMALMTIGMTSHIAENARLDIDYAAQLASDSYDHRLTALLSIKF